MKLSRRQMLRNYKVIKKFNEKYAFIHEIEIEFKEDLEKTKDDIYFGEYIIKYNNGWANAKYIKDYIDALQKAVGVIKELKSDLE